ncbi:MAG: hypothetical protein ABI743_02345 [bacterium]
MNARLLTASSVLLLTTLALGCSGSATAPTSPSTDLQVRATAHNGGGDDGPGDDGPGGGGNSGPGGGGGNQSECVTVFDLGMVADDSRREHHGNHDWEGNGRFMIDTCPVEGAGVDANISVRVPEFNRRLRVGAILDSLSTPEDQHYTGLKERSFGDELMGGQITWTVDSHILTSSVAPVLRVEGSVTRDRLRWRPDAVTGERVEQSDTLTATFAGVPVSEPEPENCPDL